MVEENLAKNNYRYIILIAGIAIQLCAGTLYMWSVYNADVAAHLLWDKTSTGFTVPFMLTFFVIGNIIGGRIMDKIGPMKICIAGSLIMSGGIFISSQVTSNMPELIWLTYGIIGGTGVGIVYTCTVSPIQKWFFDRKGFATGLMVGAFGGSLVLFTPVVKMLLSNFGVPSTFMIVGIAFLLVCVPASFFLKNPPAGYVIPKTSAAATQKQFTPKEMVKTKAFYFIIFSVFFITSAYFVLNPQFISLGRERGLTEEAALLAVMITGICSAGGRVSIAWMSDITGRISGLLLIFALTITGVLILLFAEGPLYILCLALIAFGYGGVAGIYAVITSDNFGTKKVGSNYGIVLIGFGVSAPLFILLSAKFPATETNIIFYICTAACIATLVCILLLRKYAIANYGSRKKTDT